MVRIQKYCFQVSDFPSEKGTCTLHVHKRRKEQKKDLKSQNDGNFLNHTLMIMKMKKWMRENNNHRHKTKQNQKYPQTKEVEEKKKGPTIHTQELNDLVVIHTPSNHYERRGSSQVSGVLKRMHVSESLNTDKEAPTILEGEELAIVMATPCFGVWKKVQKKKGKKEKNQFIQVTIIFWQFDYHECFQHIQMVFRDNT